MADRVEFRVICKDSTGTELVWKMTDTLQDAIAYVESLEPNYHKRCEWLVYEIRIAESATLVHSIQLKKKRKSN